MAIKDDDYSLYYLGILHFSNCTTLFAITAMILHRLENLNPLSHPNATLAPQARQARASGENLNYLLSH